MRNEDKKFYKKYVWVKDLLGNIFADREREFDLLIKRSTNKKCLQIGIQGEKHGSNWVSVDKFDNSPNVDFHYDVQKMPFPDNEFDVVVARAILEHVERPWIAAKELIRVTKKGGELWIEVPFNQPYHPSPGDFWRTTPEGLRILMEGTKEILCGNVNFDDSVIYNGAIYYGVKL